jgi:hypothetical protein
MKDQGGAIFCVYDKQRSYFSFFSNFNDAEFMQ